MDQLRDEEFLTKQLRRMEMVLGASARHLAIAGGRNPSIGPHTRGLFVTATPSRGSLQQRLLRTATRGDTQSLDGATSDGGASAVRGGAIPTYSDSPFGNVIDSGGSAAGELAINAELDRLNALYLLGGLAQPELAALMLQKLKELLLHLCALPDPFYELLALRRYILRSVHDAVRIQHQHQKALGILSASALTTLEDAINATRRVSPELGSRDIIASGGVSGSSRAVVMTRRRSLTGASTRVKTPRAPGLQLGTSLPVKGKEKAAREGVMGVQVVLSLFSSLTEQSVASLAQKREVLRDLVLLIRSLEPQSLAPRIIARTTSPARSAPSAIRGCTGSSASTTVESQELVDRIQRFLLEVCPPPAPRSGPSLSKVHAAAPSSGEFDVGDRTAAVNALLCLAAARSSVRGYLLAVRVILGVSDVAAESLRDSSIPSTPQWPSPASVRSPRVATPLTSSVPLLRVKREELLLSSLVSEDDDDVFSQDESGNKHRSKRDPGSVDQSVGGTKCVQIASDRSDYEDSVISTHSHDLVSQVKRKALPRGFVPKAIVSTSITAMTVNIVPSAHQRLSKFQGSSATGGGSTAKTKESARGALLDDSVTFSLDISVVQDSTGRDDFTGTTSSRLDGHVQTARYPKLKPLHVLSVLRDLDLAKPGALLKRCSASQVIGTSVAHSSLTGDGEYDEKEVWSCGQNSYGELGHGDTITRKSFDRIEALQRRDVIQVSAGNEHSIILCGDGAVLTCGYNDNGQCGVGATNRVSTVMEMQKLGDQRVTQVHAYNGCEHSVVVTQEGRAATFGYNYRGQLGHGSTSSENVPKLIRSLDGRAVRLVSCSYYHTILVCAEPGGGGRDFVYTFGRNDYGQLGHNDAIDRKVPQHVEALAEQHAVSVACGQYHTLVVTSTGKAYGFGKNDYGQLGVESLDNQLLPVQVRGGLEKQICLEVRCGYYHSIVLCSGSRLYGFGRNDYGQLGLGRSNATVSANLQLQQQRFASAQLIEDLEGKEIVRFACGCYHTVAVSDSGVLFVFGRNNHGQLGTGDTTERVYPFPIEDFLGKRVAMVAAGFYHTIVLTGGKDEEVSEQTRKDDGATSDDEKRDSQAIGGGVVSSSVILTAQSVRQMLAFKPPDVSQAMETQQPMTANARESSACNDPSWDPDDEDDCRSEDERRRRESSFEVGVESSGDERATSSAKDTSGIDSIDVVVVLLAELDRLCKPYVPRPGVFTLLQHPNAELVEQLQECVKTWRGTSFDAASVFDGCFEAHVIYTCSSTFESLWMLVKHLSGKKLEHLSSSRGHGALSSRALLLPGISSSHLHVYLLLVCIRLLQANLTQMLRSGLGKLTLLFTQSRDRDGITGTHPCGLPPAATELERLAVVFHQLRECLFSLVDAKYPNASGIGGTVSEGHGSSSEMASDVADEAVDTIMQGFELFFPCQCEQRRFFLHVLESPSTIDVDECACGGRKVAYTMDAYPRSRKRLLLPLLRRLTDDSLLVKFVPLGSSANASATTNGSTGLALITSVYTAILNRVGVDFIRAVGESAQFPTGMPLTKAGRDGKSSTSASLLSLLVALHKHISAWAASCDGWVKRVDDSLSETSMDVAKKVAVLVDRVFRVDTSSSDDLPLPWRCYLELSQALLTQASEIFFQVVSKEPVPSPSFGSRRSMDSSSPLDGGHDSISSELLGLVEASVAGQVLSPVVSSLLVFSNVPVFAAVLLPQVMDLLRLLDDFNQRSPDVQALSSTHVADAASIHNQPRSASSNSSSWGSGHCDPRGMSPPNTSIGDVIGLPWSYLLEKEVAVLAAEMTVTLSLGEPLFSFETTAQNVRTSVSPRWISSPLLSTGLRSSFIRSSIQKGDGSGVAISDALRIVSHTPLRASHAVVNQCVSSDALSFSLVLPPARRVLSGSIDDAPVQHGVWAQIEAKALPFTDMFSRKMIDSLLDCLCSDGAELCCAKARGFCEWIRTHYAESNASYRMLLRQAARAPSGENRLENATFAALLHHNQLSHQALSFALAMSLTDTHGAKSPPRALGALWHSVADVRHRFTAMKMAIKNASAQDDPTLAVSKLQQTILERCQLLFLVAAPDEEASEQFVFDSGVVSPYHSAVSSTADTRHSFSRVAVVAHMSTGYGDEQDAFLDAFPTSRWRRVRVLVHVTARWRRVGRAIAKKSAMSTEIVDFVTSTEALSTPTAIIALLINPCRRVSSTARGLELLTELLAIPSFEPVQADIVHRFSHIVVFQSHKISESLLTQPTRPNVSECFLDQYNAALTDLLTHVSQLVAQKTDALLAATATGATRESSYRSLLGLLSCWAIHFKADQFAFVNDIGILPLLNDISKLLSTSKPPAVPTRGLSALPGAVRLEHSRCKALSRLKDTLHVLSRHVCVHFAARAVQVEKVTGFLSRATVIGTPIVPALSDAFDVILEQTREIVGSLVGSERDDVTETVVTNKRDSPETPRIDSSSSTMRRSFDVITAPRWFSPLAKGLSFAYEDMISPPANCKRPPMLPLSKPNEFSITTWIFVRNQRGVTVSPENKELTPRRELGPRFVFLRGNERELAPYLLLVLEDDNEWHFEVGVTVSPRTDLDSAATRSAAMSKNAAQARLVSKAPVHTDKWMHVAIVSEASKIRLYVNGVLDAQQNLLPSTIYVVSCASVELPFHFGKAPSSVPSATVDSVGASLRLLATTRVSGVSSGRSTIRSSDSLATDSEQALRSFDGALSSFRFHNRSLSPIHVRIVFDERKPRPSAVSSSPRSRLGLLECEEAQARSQLLDQLALLQLLSTSSEGLVHFSSHAAQWLRLLWETVIKVDDFRVQQSVLRVLRVVLPHQSPTVLCDVLLTGNCESFRDSELSSTLGFSSSEDVFAQQLLRIIGFSLCKCPNEDFDTLHLVESALLVPWTLMMPLGIHGNELSPVPDELNAANWSLHDDAHERDTSAMRALGMGNELMELLQCLWTVTTDSNHWRDSIERAILSCLPGVGMPSVFPAEREDPASQHRVRIGKRVVSRDTIRTIEGFACLHLLTGAVEFLRPGAVVEIVQQGEAVNVVALDSMELSATALERRRGVRNGVYVCASSQQANELETDGERPDVYSGWYEQVSHYARVGLAGDSQSYESSRPRYLCVNSEDVQPARSLLSRSWSPARSILYAHSGASSAFITEVVAIISSIALEQLESTADKLPESHSDSITNGQLELMRKQAVSMLLKALVQAAASSDTALTSLLSHHTLIDRVLTLGETDDGRVSFETYTEIERKVWLLRQRVHKVLIDMEDDGDVELERLLQPPVLPLQRRQQTSTLPNVDNDDDNDDNSVEDKEIEEGGLDDDDNCDNENDDADGDGDDDLEEDDDEDDENEDDEDGEESRAEFVEELMLMGFPEEWCVLALKQTENDIVSASAWIVDNLEYLSRLQTSLDKQRESGRDTPRYNEEDDDTDADDTLDSALVASDIGASNHSAGDIDSSKDGVCTVPSDATVDASPQFTEGGTAECLPPPLNDKELGRKVFGEMYFPFEDGGYQSNTRAFFLGSWRAESVESKLLSLTKPRSPTASPTVPSDDNDVTLFQETSIFRGAIDEMAFGSLVNALREHEHAFAVLNARRCTVTLCSHLPLSTTPLAPPLSTDYKRFFQLLKLVLLRWNQFSIITEGGSACVLQEKTPEQALASAMASFADRDFDRFSLSALEFCVAEIEKAASSRAFEAHLWTQRDLKRPDRTVMDEPAIEVVSWVVDVLLKRSHTMKTWGPPHAPAIGSLLRRLRYSLRSANLPLKVVAVHTISTVLQQILYTTASGNGDTGTWVNAVLVESKLDASDFLRAATLRHAREAGQHRLLFSVYLQALIEIQHVLQRVHTWLGRASSSPDSFPPPLWPPTSSQATHASPTTQSLAFDRKRCRSSLLVFSDDATSVAYSGNEVWRTVFATESFATGTASWEVCVEKSSSSYLFVGVGTQRASTDAFLGADDHSWGYIGDKALYYQRNRVKAFGDVFGEGDCIGVMIDCERGTLSFSKNGVDLGVAFESIVGEVYPAVAFYSRHQRVSFVPDSLVRSQGHADSNDARGPSAPVTLRNEDVGREAGSVEEALVVCELMAALTTSQPVRDELLQSAFVMTTQWMAGSKKYVTTRAGKPLWVDVTRSACFEFGFQSGDRVRTSRGNGVVVGVAERRLWVEVDGEQGAWFFHPSKLRTLTLISVNTTTASHTGVTSAANDNVGAPTVSADSSSNSDDSRTPTLSVDALTFDTFKTFVHDPIWTLATDREVIAALNDFCESSSVSPWNLSPSEAFGVLETKASEPESGLGTALGWLTASQAEASSSTTKAKTKLVVRVGFLRFFNAYFSRAIGYFDLTWHYFAPDRSLLPCRLVSKCRGSLFVAVKNDFFTALMETTASSPKKADDDYDYPDELPQMLLNRPKAASAKCHPGTTKSLFLSLFGQSFEELHFLPLRTQRMVYSHPMDDGQLRSFKVKFEGEGVDDYGGPYREFFSQFFAELQMLRSSGQDPDATTTVEPTVDETPTECLLPFLIPSPNWRNGVGANRERFVINAALLRDVSTAPQRKRTRASDAPPARERATENDDEQRQLYGEMFFFLGHMLGTCLRTRVCVRLDLAVSVWKHLVGDAGSDASVAEEYEASALQSLKEVDFVAYTLWKTLQAILFDYERLQAIGVPPTDPRIADLQDQLEAMDLTFTTFLSDGRATELCDGGATRPVTLTNLDTFLSLTLRARTDEAIDVMAIIKQGLNSILPVAALSLFTWRELEKRVCGVADVDVGLLQQNTEYDEDVSPQDEFVQRFWRVLAAMAEEDKRAFLRFVWARSRLPAGSAQFHQKFKIQSLASPFSGTNDSVGDIIPALSSTSTSTVSAAANSPSLGAGTTTSDSVAAGTTGGWMDSQLPKSHTCFFALQLPRYSSDAVCEKQLLYAIRNCVEMDGDFRLADTEMTGWNDIDPSDQLRF